MRVTQARARPPTHPALPHKEEGQAQQPPPPAADRDSAAKATAAGQDRRMVPGSFVVLVVAD
jgi:hypothetical protein